MKDRKHISCLYGKKKFVAAIFFIFSQTLHATPILYQNDLSGNLKQSGAIVIPYSREGDEDMYVSAVLCTDEKKCFGKPFGFDTGDLNNNINKELKKSIFLKDNAKSLPLFYLDSLLPIYSLPIYTSSDKYSRRGNYLGAQWIDKLGLWFNFGTKEIYSDVPAGKIEDYVNNSHVKYQSIPLKNLGGYRYITASINGGEGVNLLIDTGTNGDVIDKNYAEKLGLTENKEQCGDAETQAGKGYACFTHDVVSLRVNNKAIPGYFPRGMVVLNISFVLPPARIKGILGMDWLEQSGAIMSLKENRVYFPIQM